MAGFGCRTSIFDICADNYGPMILSNIIDSSKSRLVRIIELEENMFIWLLIGLILARRETLAQCVMITICRQFGTIQHNF